MTAQFHPANVSQRLQYIWLANKGMCPPIRVEIIVETGPTHLADYCAEILALPMISFSWRQAYVSREQFHPNARIARIKEISL